MTKLSEQDALARYERLGAADTFRAANSGEDWPKPDLTLIDNGRRPPVEMPSNLFGPVWSVIEEVADSTATAPDYAAMAYLSCAASLVGGKRLTAPHGANADFTVPCILWCAALGDPSSRKSAPLKMMTKPLWAIEREAGEGHEEELRSWSADVERAKAEQAAWQSEVKKVAGSGEQTPEKPALAEEPAKPAERTVIISDVTPEAAVAVLVENPQGVLCFNDELRGWLEGFNRYNPGGEAFWLAAFDGSPHKVNRKGSGTLKVDFAGISVLGSIQPDIIAPVLAGANDGLVPRILWAWPESQPPRIAKRRANLDLLERIYRRLESLPWARDASGNLAPTILPFSTDAVRTFHAWEGENATEIQGGGGMYDCFVGKLSGAVARLALIAELTQWACSQGSEHTEVSNRSVAAAIEWAEDYAKPMAQRVYGDASVSRADRNASLLARYIKNQSMDRINMRELRRHPHRGHLKPLQDKGALDGAVEVLEAAGWLRGAFSRQGDTTGQVRKDYVVNPAVSSTS